MKTEESPIWVFVETEEIVKPLSIDGERAGEDAGGGFGSPDESIFNKVTTVWKRKRVSLDAQALKVQINGLMQVVNDLFKQSEENNVMLLDEVTLSVEVDAEGHVGFAGNGGKLGNTGGITMKFVRPR